jgi:hypothetical protein
MGTDDPVQNDIAPSSAPVRLLIVVGGAGGCVVVVVSKWEEADDRSSPPPPADHDQDRITLLDGSGSVVGAVASRIWSLNETIDTFLSSSPGIASSFVAFLSLVCLFRARAIHD